ncbi:MAG: hypothetical protein PHT02_00205 [Tissierellia bacterium]|nr:hypothetical protein [Tissierellia bacterium]
MTIDNIARGLATNIKISQLTTNNSYQAGQVLCANIDDTFCWQDRPTELTFQDLIINAFKQTKYVYVSKDGSDETGDGGIYNPFLTINTALDNATSGTTIFVLPGTYEEDIIFKAGVNITSSIRLAVYIVGNHTANFSGTVVCNNVIFNSTSGNTLTFSGTNAQNFQLISASVYSTNGDAISWTNTNASSKIYFEDGTCYVSTSGANARCFYSSSTAKGSFILSRVSLKINNPDNVCLAIGGAISFTHTSDAIIGQVIVSNSANVNIGFVSMTTTSVEILNTTSTGTTILMTDTISTTASPAITGSGILLVGALLYTSTGIGTANTLNGGLGAITLPMSNVKLRANTLVPVNQVLAGQNDGNIEYDGIDLYFTIGTTRKKVAFVS